MKHGWTYKKIAEVTSLVADGDWIESKDQSETGIRLIQTGNIGVGVFKAKDDKPHYISEETFSRLGCTEIFEGDCLVSRLPDPIGRACILPSSINRMITAVDCTIIRFANTIYPPFFVYYSRSKQYQSSIDNQTTGSTRKRISRKNLERVEIPVPPIEEQKAICSLLDKLSRVIEAKKEQLKELDNLAQAIFYDMFGDTLESAPTKCLKDVAEYYIGLTYSPKDVADNGTVVLRSSNIQGNVLDFEDTVRVNMAISDKKIVQDGDILMCARNGSARLVGKVARIKNLSEKMSFGAFMTIIRSPYNDFLFQFFLSHYFRNQLITSKTATINQITTKMLDGIKLNVPSPEQQQSFAEKVEAIERQKELINQSIREVQTLFDSRMDYWFSD